MKWLVWPMALGLVACGEQPRSPQGDPPGGAGTSAATPATQTAPALQRQIGSVSGLSGSMSALNGAVSDFQVQQTEAGTVATLAADALFAFDSATIAADAAENLRRSADLIRRGGAGPIRIAGHSDGKGSDAYNDALSTRRAQAVADWLKGPGGLSDRSFEVQGIGKRAPLAPNAKPDGEDDPEGRARNRRVEITIPR